jgi:ankyrin repeat protein
LGLREAVLTGDVELARRLCDSDPNLDVGGESRFFFHDTYLMEAAGLGFLEMTRFLLDRGADIEGGDDVGSTALLKAAGAGRTEIVSLLLDRGADGNHGDWNGHSPLSRAAVEGHREIYDLLLSRGADRGLLDAVAVDDVGLVAQLLRRSSYPTHIDNRDRDLVMLAVRRGNVKIVNLLLDYGAAHHKPSVDEHPLLSEAAKHGRLDVARLLIERGADIDGIGRDGLSPVDWAKKEGHDAVVELLELASLESARPTRPALRRRMRGGSTVAALQSLYALAETADALAERLWKICCTDCRVAQAEEFPLARFLREVARAVETTEEHAASLSRYQRRVVKMLADLVLGVAERFGWSAAVSEDGEAFILERIRRHNETAGARAYRLALSVPTADERVLPTAVDACRRIAVELGHKPLLHPLFAAGRDAELLRDAEVAIYVFDHGPILSEVAVRVDWREVARAQRIVYAFRGHSPWREPA